MGRAISLFITPNIMNNGWPAQHGAGIYVFKTGKIKDYKTYTSSGKLIDTVMPNKVIAPASDVR